MKTPAFESGALMVLGGAPVSAPIRGLYTSILDEADEIARDRKRLVLGEIPGGL